MNVTMSELIDIVFAEPPKDICTYNLMINCKENFSPNVTLDAFMFPYLMNILITGAVKLYGKDIRADNMTAEQFDTIKTYISSLGYRVKHRNNVHDDGSITMNIWFERIKCIMDCHGRKVI